MKLSILLGKDMSRKPFNRKKKIYRGIDSDYNYLVVDVFIDMIQTTNDIDKSCSCIGINRQVYERWMVEHKEFAKRVTEAQEIYRENTPLALKAIAQKQLTKYLRGEQSRTTTIEESFYDENGNIRNSKVTKKTESIEAPRWAIERVLGTDISELDAVKTLVDSQWIDSDIVDEISDKLSKLNSEIKDIISLPRSN